MTSGRKRINLIGQTFGRLYVLREHHISGFYICRCECLNEKIVAGYQLRKGSTKSCGCLVKEKTGNLNRGKASATRKDLTGQKFNHIQVVSFIGTEIYYHGKPASKYKCLCDCGKEFEAFGVRFTSGILKTCGDRTQAHKKLMESYEINS